MIGAWKLPKCRPRGWVAASWDAAEDSQVIAVMGTPEVLGPRPESPEALAETAEVPPAVTETPEAMIGPRGLAVAVGDSRVVAVTGTPKALGPRLESPEALPETAEEPLAVTATPKAVDTGIPERPTS